jgi:hypothetical protein
LHSFDFAFGFIFPIEYQEKSEKHPAEMGKMGYSAVASYDAVK